MEGVTSAPASVDVLVRAVDVDVTVSLDANDPRILADARDRFRAAWAGCLVDTRGTTVADLPARPRATVRLRLDEGHGREAAPDAPRDTGEPDEPDDALVAADYDSAASFLTQRITSAAIREQSGRLFMLHGGALCRADGRGAVVVVGPGGAGKTTLVRALGDTAGRDHTRRLLYLTDETAAIDGLGRVVPYPKPLSIRRDDGLASAKDEVDPRALGLSPATEPAPLRRVILLARARPGEREQGPPDRGVEVEALATLDAICALTPETSALPQLESPLARFAGLLESTGGALRVRYSEASDLAPLVDDLLA